MQGGTSGELNKPEFSKAFCGSRNPVSFQIIGAPPLSIVGKLPLAVAGTPDPKLIHPMSKSVWVEIQDSRCALWPLNDSSGLLKGGNDMTSLQLLHCLESCRFRVCR